MKKLFFSVFFVVLTVCLYAQNKSISTLALSKNQQAALERNNPSLLASTASSLPEQDAKYAIPVCQTNYSVANSYIGSGLMTEITFTTGSCLLSGEKNSVWYSFNCKNAGRLKFTIIPNQLTDDYDYALYDITGRLPSAVQKDSILPIICNYSAQSGKTGLDSSGVNYIEPAIGSVFNPIINISPGHNYLLYISNFTGSTYGYNLSFTGTTANIFGNSSQVQSVNAFCGADSVVVNLSNPVLKSSIAPDGSDFILSGTSGTYSISNAYGVGTLSSSQIVLKLLNSLVDNSTYTLNLVSGTDGNIFLNTCNYNAVSIPTYTFNNLRITSSVNTFCTGEQFTLTASPAASYTWTGALVDPGQENSQSITATSTSSGAITFTLSTSDNCGGNMMTYSVLVNPKPIVTIASSTPSFCPGVSVNLTASGASSYLWSVGTATNDSNPTTYQTTCTSTIFTARPLNDNTYYVVGTNSVGCSMSASYSLTALAGPTVSIAGPDTICYGSSATLLFTGAADAYTWGTGATTSSIIVTPTANSTYYVNASLINGCHALGTKTIAVMNTPITNPIKYVCIGDSTLLTAPVAISYSWSTGATTNTIYVKPTAPTTYTVWINTGSCGSMAVTYPVSFYAQPNIPISLTSTVCAYTDTTYLFNPSTTAGLTSYTWSTGSHTNIGATPAYVPFSLSNNVFSISVGATNSSGCIAFNTLTYTVFPSPQNVYVTSSNDICSGSTTTLTGHGADLYRWTGPGGGGYGQATTAPFVTTQTATSNYYVQGINNYGCYGNHMLYTIGTNTTTNLSASVSPSVICSGQSASFIAQGNGVFYWYNSDTSSTILSMNKSYVPYFNAPGTYSVFVSSTCSNGTRIPVVVQVNQTPTITISNTGRDTVCAGAPFTLNASGASTYTWSTNSIIGSSATYSTTSISYAYTSTNYQVIGTTPDGCTGYKTKTIVTFPKQVIQTTASPTLVCAGMPSTVSIIGVPNYTWSTGVVSNTTVVYSNGTYTTATYTVVNNYGCYQSDPIYVPADNSAAQINYFYPYLCSGSNILLSTSGFTNYTWNTGLSNNSLYITNLTPGAYTYSVNGVNQNGCLRQANTTFTVVQSPTVQLTPNYNPICSNVSLYLTVNGNADTYTVTTPSYTTAYVGFPYGQITSPVSFTTVGKKLMPAPANVNCYTTYTNTVLVNTATLVSIAASNTSICTGQTTTITAQGVPNYTFTGGPNNSAYVVQPAGTTTYYVNGRDLNGCASTQSISINVDGSAYFVVSPNSTTVCANTTVGALAYNNNSPATTWLWQPDGQTTAAANLTPSVSTIYSVTAFNNSCSYTRTVGITTKPTPTVSISSTGTLTCAQKPTLYATASPSVSYNWYYYSGGSYNNAGSNTNTITAFYPLTYKCIVTSSLSGCGSSATYAAFPIDNTPPVISYTAPSTICSGQSAQILASGTSSYNLNFTGTTTNTVFAVTPSVTTTYTLWGWGSNQCVAIVNPSIVVSPNPTVSITGATSACEGNTIALNASGATNYTWSTGATTSMVSDVPSTTTIYSVIGSNVNNCIGTASTQVVVNQNPTVTVVSNSICIGSSATLAASGANNYSWNTGATTNSITENPSITTIYSVTGTNLNNCSGTRTVSVIVDNTCQDVWPGDANSDGTADNLDILELGLHYGQIGAPRTSTSNSWQSYHADNWTGTISNGKNLNHSDCNGDGIINNDDTLAIYNNYGLTHAFKPANTTTVNPQLSIVPDQSALTAGSWGTSSIYLGDAANPINNVNGIAFTVNFDHTLIESNSVWIEYPSSFVNASNQNLHFRKLDFNNDKIYTTTTHTVNNNVSGNGLIGILHYKISSSLSNDYVLNLGISQANKSDVSGVITPLTANTNTVMALGLATSLVDATNGTYFTIQPNPSNGLVVISSTSDIEKIEVLNLAGQILVSERVNSKTHQPNLENLANGVYFVKVYNLQKQVSIRKLVVQR